MVDTRSAGYIHAVAARSAAVLGDALVGVYLHGSAVLGDFAPSRSDVDLLVVTTRPLADADKRQLANALAAESLPCPATGLELSVVTRAVTLDPVPAPPFELHLATGATGATGDDTTRVVDGHAHGGDPDLLLHFAVCRDRGRAVAGSRPPREVFAPVPRAWLLAGLARELAWAERHASVEYLVLNACRAWRFAAEDVLCSKLDGGRWARGRLDDPTVVVTAIGRRQGRSARMPAEPAVSALVRDVLDLLEREQATAQRSPPHAAAP